MTNANTIPQYGPATFAEPAPYGYLYLGMRIRPPRHAPFVRGSAERDRVVERCSQTARQLETLAEVVAVTVYRAVFIPPIAGSPRFDVLVLIETTSPEAIPAVEAAEAYRELEADFVMKARNIRRIGDIDSQRTGMFLFNHFWADDPEDALRTWDNLSGWFPDRAGVADSALLQPIGADTYVFVNHVRLPCGPMRFLLRFARPSFRTYVTANLRAHDISQAPVFCQAVQRPQTRTAPNTAARRGPGNEARARRSSRT